LSFLSKVDDSYKKEKKGKGKQNLILIKQGKSKKK